MVSWSKKTAVVTSPRPDLQLTTTKESSKLFLLLTSMMKLYFSTKVSSLQSSSGAHWHQLHLMFVTLTGSGSTVQDSVTGVSDEHFFFLSTFSIFFVPPFKHT